MITALSSAVNILTQLYNKHGHAKVTSPTYYIGVKKCLPAGCTAQDLGMEGQMVQNSRIQIWSHSRIMITFNDDIRIQDMKVNQIQQASRSYLRSYITFNMNIPDIHIQHIEKLIKFNKHLDHIRSHALYSTNYGSQTLHNLRIQISSHSRISITFNNHL